jgi:hypothetical protein
MNRQRVSTQRATPTTRATAVRATPTALNRTAATALVSQKRAAENSNDDDDQEKRGLFDNGQPGDDPGSLADAMDGSHPQDPAAEEADKFYSAPKPGSAA